MSNGTIKKLPEVKDAEMIASDFFRIGACICEKIESGYNSAFTTGSSFSVAPFEPIWSKQMVSFHEKISHKFEGPVSLNAFLTSPNFAHAFLGNNLNLAGHSSACMALGWPIMPARREPSHMQRPGVATQPQRGEAASANAGYSFWHRNMLRIPLSAVTVRDMKSSLNKANCNQQSHSC